MLDKNCRIVVTNPLNEGFLNFFKKKKELKPKEPEHKEEKQESAESPLIRSISAYVRKKIAEYHLSLSTDDVLDSGQPWYSNSPKYEKWIEVWNICFQNDDNDYGVEPYESGFGTNFGYAAINKGRLILSKAIFELNGDEETFSKTGVKSIELDNPQINRFIDNFFKEQQGYFDYFKSNKGAQERLMKALTKRGSENIFDVDEEDLKDPTYTVSFSFFLTTKLTVHAERHIKYLLRL